MDWVDSTRIYHATVIDMNGYQKVFLGYFVALLIFWIALWSSHSTDSIYNYIYSLCFSLTPLIAGVIGMYRSRIWGGLSSHVGKAVFFISLGVFLWGAGSMVWSYYNLVAQVEMPYPSLADLGFAPSIFFYGLGAMYLSRATGAKYGLRNRAARLFVILAPIVILALSYYVLIVLARGGVLVPEGETWLKALLDIAYPLGDFIGLTIAVIVSGLSFPYLGGAYLPSIISVLSGLAVMYIADSIFSYTTTVGTFYNGDPGDLVLTIGLFLLSFGVLGFGRMRLSGSADSSPQV